VRFVYGALTLCGGTFQNPSATQQLCNSVERLAPLPPGPTTPYRQRRQAWHRHGLGSSRFARRYSGSRVLLSFPQGTEMFQFPWFPLPALCVQAGVPPFFAAVGSPIRTSTDQCSVGSSPWLIAATHVLHRLQAPRHPPLAFVAWRTRCSCSLCNSQGAQGSNSCHPWRRARERATAKARPARPENGTEAPGASPDQPGGSSPTTGGLGWPRIASGQLRRLGRAGPGCSSLERR
jgi:hypothetical protein